MRTSRETWAPIFERLSQRELRVERAAALIDRSERQVRRLLASYRSGGSAALIRGNRGRPPAHTLDSALRERILDLAKADGAARSARELASLLHSREGVLVSQATITRLLARDRCKSDATKKPVERIGGHSQPSATPSSIAAQAPAASRRSVTSSPLNRSAPSPARAISLSPPGLGERGPLPICRDYGAASERDGSSTARR